tara:strand:- start:406 stop:1632 length:1227 start_codon:yes stop_codon:yes gene_type:complete
MLRWIFIIIFFSVFEFYAFQAIKTITNNRSILLVYFLIVALILGNLTYHSLIFDRSIGFTHYFGYALGLFLSLFVSQLCIISFLFLEDIYRVIQGIYDYFTYNLTDDFIPERRKFISKIALITGLIPFSSLIYGMFYGRYNYKVLKYSLTFDNLPKEFDGFKITQISDIHCGSFDNKEKVKYGVDLINEQKSDVILFTGDIVNNKASELIPWIDIFKTLKAPSGKFSILGNHDYGDYANWKSIKDKEDNFNLLLKSQKEMGFELLLNQSKYINKENSKIAIVGVENWGEGFKKKGDLNLATEKITKKDFKILLTHDPSHWEAEALNHDKLINLTLSGHTHGMQFGIEIPGIIKWSPVKWRYKQWAGIYNRGKKFLNVNRGFGYLAYPGRVGIWPEITVITLKSSMPTI